MSTPISSQGNPPTTLIVRLIMIQLLEQGVMFGMIGIFLFIAAGRLDWWDAWVFLIIYFMIAFASGLWLLRYDPKLMQERYQAVTKDNVKPWDRAMVTINLMLTAALFITVGVDAGRWGWSQVPLWLRILAGVVILLSFSLTLWASSVNTFMSANVRIQEERGHKVIASGPYNLVRHPMYAGMCLLDLGIPLVLNSWWGLLVSVMMIAAVVVRTVLEDGTLQRELAGYAEYAQEVQYRLLPGVW